MHEIVDKWEKAGLTNFSFPARDLESGIFWHLAMWTVLRDHGIIWDEDWATVDRAVHQLVTVVPGSIDLKARTANDPPTNRKR